MSCRKERCRTKTSIFAALALCAFTQFAGCRTSSILPRDLGRELDKSIEDIDHVYVIKTAYNNKAESVFPETKEKISLSLEDVKALARAYNPNIIIARREFDRRRHEFDRLQAELWEPSLFFNTSLDAEDIIAKNQAGAQIRLPFGTRIRASFDQRYLHELVGEEGHHYQKKSAIRMEIPMPFLHPEFYSYRRRSFKQDMDLIKGRNSYVETVREITRDAINRYIDSREQYENILLLETYIGRLEKIRPHLPPEEQKQMDADLYAQAQTKLDKLLTSTYPNTLSDLRGRLGMPESQEIEPSQMLEFENTSISDDLLEILLHHDFGTINLSLDLAYAQREIPEAESSILRPTLFFGYENDLNGSDRYDIGINIEVRLGSSSEPERSRVEELVERLRRHYIQKQIYAESFRRRFDGEFERLNRQLINAENAEDTLAEAEIQLGTHRISYTGIRPLLENWFEKRESAIRSTADAMKLIYEYQSLTGEFDKTEYKE